MDILPLILELAAGAAGGNLAGKLLPKSSMGNLANSILGIVGGGLGGQILSSLGIGGASGAGNLIADLLGGGVGGGVLMAVIGLVKGMLAKKA